MTTTNSAHLQFLDRAKKLRDEAYDLAAHADARIINAVANAPGHALSFDHWADSHPWIGEHVYVTDIRATSTGEIWLDATDTDKPDPIPYGTAFCNRPLTDLEPLARVAIAEYLIQNDIIQ